MPRVQFQQDTALPFGGEAQFFKAGAWYTIGNAHFDLIKRNKLAFIEEGGEAEPEVKVELEVETEIIAAPEVIQQPDSEYDGDILAALEILVDESEPHDFVTTTGLPKKRSVERVLGRNISQDEVKRHWKYVLDH